MPARRKTPGLPEGHGQSENENRRESPIDQPSPRVLFNWEDWLPYLGEMDATDEEKCQFIEALWSIIQSFVDLHWKVTDEVPESSGQAFDLTAELRAAVINSKGEPNQLERKPDKENVKEVV